MFNRTTLVAAAFLALTACATAGTQFDTAAANRVTNGMTREEVIAIMGSPPTSISDNGNRFVWVYSEANLVNVKTRSARFDFGPDGKTHDVPEGGIFANIDKYMKK